MSVVGVDNNETEVHFKACTVKLYPNKTQLGYFPQVVGLCNAVYNLCLEQDRTFFGNKKLFRKVSYETILDKEGNPVKDENGKDKIRVVRNPRYYVVNRFAQDAELKSLKEEFPFFNIAPHCSLSASVKAFHQAREARFNAYKNGTAKGSIKLGFRKHDRNRSFEIPGFTVSLTINKDNGKTGKILMPNLARYVANKQDEASPLSNGKKHKASKSLGMVKFRGLNLPKGAKITKIIVKEEADGWYATIFYKIVVGKPLDRRNDDPVGIDRNVKNLCVDSNGKMVESDQFYGKSLPKIRKAQRKLERQQKTSNRRKKTRKELARLHQTVARKRKDSLHKTTTKIAKSHGVVVLEDLQISNMTKSNKGTVENPGVNRAQKRGLNRSILDQGWGIMRNMLAYKLVYSGGMLGSVPAHFTSQTCPECKHKGIENRVTRDKFKCGSCGHEAQADHNAGINIRVRWGTASAKPDSVYFRVKRDVLRVAEFSA